MTQDLFVASWEKGSGAWQARHGLSNADYQRVFNDMLAQGYRLKSVSGYEVGGQDRYAAIWDKSAGGAFAARHGLSSADYQTAFNQMMAQGYRLKMVNGYSVGGKDRYAAIWEKTASPAWAARHNLSAADYQKAFDDMLKQGYRLRWISTYVVGGQDRYAAIWDKGTGPSWQARHHLEEAAFRAQHQAFAAQGYDLICADAATLGGKDYYCGLWEQNPAASVAHHGMTSGAYQLKVEELLAQGWQPRFVTGYQGADPVDVKLRFTMQKQQQGNWCWAATSVSIARFYGNTTWTQCAMANGELSRNDCCGTGASTLCNVYGTLGTSIDRTGHFVNSTGSTATFDQIEGQVVANRPLGIRVAWSGGGAHFIAATGTEDDGSVWVSDCGSGTTSLVAYNTLKTAYNGSGSWTHTYFTKP